MQERHPNQSQPEKTNKPKLHAKEEIKQFIDDCRVGIYAWLAGASMWTSAYNYGSENNKIALLAGVISLAFIGKQILESGERGAYLIRRNRMLSEPNKKPKKYLHDWVVESGSAGTAVLAGLSGYLAAKGDYTLAGISGILSNGIAYKTGEIDHFQVRWNRDLEKSNSTT